MRVTPLGLRRIDSLGRKKPYKIFFPAEAVRTYASGFRSSHVLIEVVDDAFLPGCLGDRAGYARR